MMTSDRRARINKRATALVTGGAVRLGRSIVLALVAAGHDVAIGYHRSEGPARRLAAELRARGVRTVALRADLGRPAAARRLVERAAESLGGLDVLVNNAAVFVRTPLATTTPAQFDALVAVNLRGAFLCAQAAAALMRRGGHIVNVGDVGGDRAWPGYIAYTVTKAGIAALTRGLAAALRPRAIAVNCVAPGAVLRPVGFPVARWRALTRGRAGSPADVAAAVAFFATCPPHITGQVLKVDGGETA